MTEHGSASDPFEWFQRWYGEARNSLPGADAVALATAGVDGQPSVRFVHFKGLRADGFVFYTNYGSRKAVELAANPAAALAFCWLPLKRQVRVEGRCSRLDRATSERYFSTRSRESQLSSMASEQSHELGSFDVLEERIEVLRAAYVGREIPCPPNWGGIVLKAEHMEFWEGQAHRRHRRYRYDHRGNTWNVRFLYP
jgi:pyridoxamine 5'-phosphate oxidase